MGGNAEVLPDEDGNYDSPVMRKLTSTWDDYDDGEIEVEDVLDVLDRIETLTVTQIEAMEENEGDDPTNPDRLAILDAFHAHLDGLDRMREFFEIDDPELVDEAMDLIQDATNQMVKGMLKMERHEEHQLPKCCLRCSAANPREARLCKSCNAMFPVLEPMDSFSVSLEVLEGEQTAPGPQRTTPDHTEMTEAHDAWNRSELSYEEFGQVAERIRDRHQAEVDFLRRQLPRAGDKITSEYYNERLAVIEQSRDAADVIVSALRANDAHGVDSGMWSLDRATTALLNFDDEWIMEELEPAA